MNEFLNETTQTVTKSIEADTSRKRIYEGLSEEPRNIRLEVSQIIPI